MPGADDIHDFRALIEQMQAERAELREVVAMLNQQLRRLERSLPVLQAGLDNADYNREQRRIGEAVKEQVNSFGVMGAGSGRK